MPPITAGNINLVTMATKSESYAEAIGVTERAIPEILPNEISGVPKTSTVTPKKLEN